MSYNDSDIEIVKATVIPQSELPVVQPVVQPVVTTNINSNKIYF